MGEVRLASQDSLNRLYDNMKQTVEDVYKQQYVDMVLNEALGKGVLILLLIKRIESIWKT